MLHPSRSLPGAVDTIKGLASLSTGSQFPLSNSHLNAMDTKAATPSILAALPDYKLVAENDQCKAVCYIVVSI